MLAITEEQYLKYIKGKSRYGVIYKITNTINGDFYIGSSRNFNKRYYSHLNDIRTNRQSCVLLIRAAFKYGEKNFKLEILEECEPNIVLDREQYYLDKYSPKYNVAKVAGSNFGIKRTSVTRVRKSLAQKNNWQNEKYREKHLSELSKNWKKGGESFNG
jgi:group I intron endonuclease